MSKLERFDEGTYLELNPDVEDAVCRGQFKSGREHWLKHGKSEGRLVSHQDLSLPDGECPQGWDEVRYLRMNPDVAAAKRAGVFTSGYAHWAAHGEDEGRYGGLSTFRLTPPKESFSRRPFGFNYFGFHSMQNGLASAAHGYLDALRLVSSDVSVIDVPAWTQELLEKPPCRSDLCPKAINVVHQNPNMVPYFLHHYSQKTFEDHYNIGIWVWELHCGYPEWLHASRFFHEIWVPSTYVADSLRPVCAAQLIKVPHVVSGLPENAVFGRATLGWPENAFVFLYVFDVASTLERKNPFALIHAFRRAFRDRKDVFLALKYHHTSDDPTGVQVLENLAAESSNIRTLSETMSEEQVYSLFQLSDCFVSPHRSEGFGLNIAQAMYYGKPVIATGYSGNLDFTNSENSLLIDYNLISLNRDHRWYRQGYGWADPSVEHLSALLKEVVTNRDKANERAEHGQRLVRESFKADVIVKELARLKLEAKGGARNA